ncbi:MAG: metal-dependent hydrolase [Pirellulaceae bacterium]|jgi:L-ascorbate metabolism protein UlaG (beta-lactamase superfamily)|nr:metal-dependent hydrolase [Pirellulaceae bacterium]MDP6557090.1 metal-dependent hydrolase [Pirellulaceae bacterium]MDP6719854.1 metal-dependent hydrolase [Pirellulaceae bacterium]
MTTEITWLGHGSWAIETGGHTILLDPFLNDSPTSPVKADDVKADYILVSHGHFDHVADVASIANRTGATVVAAYEVSAWFESQHGVKNTVGMNLGGGIDLPFGRVTMTVAHHSSQLPDGSYGGNPAGFLLKLADGTVYFACDTALFSDMQLIGRAGIDLAVLPIGDLFTMGPADSIEAIKLIHPRRVAPAHYNTWPPIEQNAATWADSVRANTEAEPVVLDPGDKFTL